MGFIFSQTLCPLPNCHTLFYCTCFVHWSFIISVELSRCFCVTVIQGLCNISPLFRSGHSTLFLWPILILPRIFFFLYKWTLRQPIFSPILFKLVFKRKNFLFLLGYCHAIIQFLNSLHFTGLFVCFCAIYLKKRFWYIFQYFQVEVCLFVKIHWRLATIFKTSKKVYKVMFFDM